MRALDFINEINTILERKEGEGNILCWEIYKVFITGRHLRGVSFHRVSSKNKANL